MTAAKTPPPIGNLMLGVYAAGSASKWLDRRMRFSELVDRIAGPELAAVTERYRAMVDEQGVTLATKAFKKGSFESLTLCGVIVGQRAGGFPVYHGGLYQVDIDGDGAPLKPETALELRSRMAGLESVALSFASLSYGVKLAVRGAMARNEAEHRNQWTAAYAAVRDFLPDLADLGAKIDRVGAPPNSLCFICADAGVYANPDAVPLAWQDQPAAGVPLPGLRSGFTPTAAPSGEMGQLVREIGIGLAKQGYPVRWRGANAFETSTAICHGGVQDDALLVSAGQYGPVASCFTDGCTAPNADGDNPGHREAVRNLCRLAGVAKLPPTALSRAKTGRRLGNHVSAPAERSSRMAMIIGETR